MDADRLDALLADAVAADAGRARVGRRVLRQAAEESATFAGTLVDLAERAEMVTLRTTLGRVHRGVIVAVGRDFAVLRDAAQPPVLIAHEAIASIRTQPANAPGPDTAGDRKPPLDATFASIIGGAAADRPTVQVGVRGETALVRGELRAAGRDVLTLRIDHEGRSQLYVPVAAVTELVLLDL